MRGVWPYLWAFAAGAVAAAGLAPHPGQAQPAAVGPRPERPDRIGFVDADEVFQKYRRKVQLEKELEGEMAGLQDKIRKLADSIRDLRKKSENTRSVWAEQAPIQQEIAEKGSQIQALREYGSVQMEWREREMARILREEMEAEIRATAEELGYTLILSKYVTTWMPEQPGGQPQPNRRPVVMHSDARHNLTETVLNRLNRK